MRRRPAGDFRLRVTFVAAGSALWAAPFLYALVRKGWDDGPGWSLLVLLAFPAIPYYLYWVHVGTRAGSIVAGTALALIVGGSHLAVWLASAGGDEQAGILYVYVLGAAAVVVAAVDVFEQRRARKPKR